MLAVALLVSNGLLAYAIFNGVNDIVGGDACLSMLDEDVNGAFFPEQQAVIVKTDDGIDKRVFRTLMHEYGHYLKNDSSEVFAVDFAQCMLSNAYDYVTFCERVESCDGC